MKHHLPRKLRHAEPAYGQFVQPAASFNQDPLRFPTYTHLQRYLQDQVKGRVGLLADALKSELHQDWHQLGHAFQLSEILFNLKADYQGKKALFLPENELIKFGVLETDLEAGIHSPALKKLVEFQIERIQALLKASKEVVWELPPEWQKVVFADIAHLEERLRQLRVKNGDVFAKPIHLTKVQELAIRRNVHKEVSRRNHDKKIAEKLQKPPKKRITFVNPLSKVIKKRQDKTGKR